MNQVYLKKGLLRRGGIFLRGNWWLRRSVGVMIFLEDDLVVAFFSTKNLNARKKDTFNHETFVTEELRKFTFEKLFYLATIVGEIGRGELSEDIAETGTRVRTNNFGNKIITNIFPEFRGVGFVNTEEYGAFNRDTLTVLSGGENSFVTEGFFIGKSKGFLDSVLENLSVKEFSYLPERDFEVKSGTKNFVENTTTTVIDTSDMTRRNRDEKTTNNLINQKRDNKFIEISHRAWLIINRQEKDRISIS